MKIQCIVNNYILGAKVKTSPIHKLVSKSRLDKSHTLLIYDNIERGEKDLIEKLFSRKVEIL